MKKTKKNPHAVALGRLGGKAGTGQSQARPSDVARRAALARWAKARARKAAGAAVVMATLLCATQASAIPLSVLVEQERVKLDKKVAAFEAQCANPTGDTITGCIEKRIALGRDLGGFVMLVRDEMEIRPEFDSHLQWALYELETLGWKGSSDNE